MANTKSAKKRARQTIKKTAINERVRSQVRKALKSARDVIGTKNKEGAELLKSAISNLSKAANKGIIHKKNASRRISRLMKRTSAAVAKKA